MYWESRAAASKKLHIPHPHDDHDTTVSAIRTPESWLWNLIIVQTEPGLTLAAWALCFMLTDCPRSRDHDIQHMPTMACPGPVWSYRFWDQKSLSQVAQIHTVDVNEASASFGLRQLGCACETPRLPQGRPAFSVPSIVPRVHLIFP